MYHTKIVLLNSFHYVSPATLNVVSMETLNMGIAENSAVTKHCQSLLLQRLHLYRYLGHALFWSYYSYSCNSLGFGKSDFCDLFLFHSENRLDPKRTQFNICSGYSCYRTAPKECTLRPTKLSYNSVFSPNIHIKCINDLALIS